MTFLADAAKWPERIRVNGMTSIIDPSEHTTILEKWRGAKARLWQYHASHGRMALMMLKPEESQQLFLVAVACRHICGPAAWDNCEIEIVRASDDVLLVRDGRAAFELRCQGGVTMAFSTMGEFQLT